MKKILLILFIICSITNSYAIVSTRQVGDCVEILLKNGIKIQAQIMQNSATGIGYRICDSQDTSVRKLEKKDIATVETADGDIIYQDEHTILNKKNAKKIEPTETKENKKYNALSVASLVLSLLSLVLLGFKQFVPSIISALFATILGGISLAKVKKETGKINFQSMSKTGIGISVSILIIMLIAVIIILILFFIYVAFIAALIAAIF